MGKPAAPISVFLLAVLTFHVATATLGGKESCDCCRHDHEIGCCCDCAECVAGRDGLSSYCSLVKGKPNQGSGRNTSFKPLRCKCGSRDTFDSPKNSLLFLPCSGFARMMIAPWGDAAIREIPLNLDDVALSRDHPG